MSIDLAAVCAPRTHAQRISRAAGGTPIWATPRTLFDALHAEFGFTVDAAAHADNALCPWHWNELDDGRAQSWSGERVWCNPPYGRDIGNWTRKAATGEAEVAVLLVPSRTDTAWWHRDVIPHAEVRFVKGRLRFGGQTVNAPFPSAVLVFRGAATPAPEAGC